LSHPSIRKFILLLLALCGFSNALLFDCAYSIESFTAVSSVYTCKAKVIGFGIHDNILHGITGNHKADGYDKTHVQALKIVDQNIPSLPKEIERFFPNLKVLYVYNSQLKTISKEDLKPFPGLRHLVIWNNKLEALDGDLFAKNPNLEYIDLDGNKIKNVGSGLLNSLSSLKYVYFDSNTCISRRSSGSDIESFKQDLVVKCPPTNEMIYGDMIKILTGRFFKLDH